MFIFSAINIFLCISLKTGFSISLPSIIHKTAVEGFGIAYVEAAQYGIPSIGGKDGGASDAIKNNETGIICDGNNLEEIYSSIDLILKNNSYEEMGKIGRAHV